MQGLVYCPLIKPGRGTCQLVQGVAMQPNKAITNSAVPRTSAARSDNRYKGQVSPIMSPLAQKSLPLPRNSSHGR
jgi:hypothetical protein